MLFLLIKWTIFKDLWFWPQIFLKVVETQKQPICHFKPLIWGFQILGGLGCTKIFITIFSCFKNVVLLYVYYMGYAIIWKTLYILGPAKAAEKWVRNLHFCLTRSIFDGFSKFFFSWKHVSIANLSKPVPPALHLDSISATFENFLP